MRVSPVSWLALQLAIAMGPIAVAGPILTYVTGEAPVARGGDANVIFRIIADPAVAFSGVVSVAVTDPGFRLDGIDFKPGSTTAVTVGAQGFAGGGAITSYDVSTATILPRLCPLRGSEPGHPPF